MSRVRVKIEGLRDPQTAVQVARMGADAVGLVFAESPRRVEPDQAGRIVTALPPWVATVGVFVNTPTDAINAAVARTGIGWVQLHGDEPPETVGRIERPCIKAFRVRDAGWAEEVRAWLAGVPAGARRPAILLDAFDPRARGGTGRAFNWQLVADARQAGQLDDIGPIILAGGLTSDNVGEAIELVRPWAVDVASGVESAPGVKDMNRIEAFLKAVAQTAG